MIDRNFVEKIEEMAAIEQFELSDVHYFTKELFPVMPFMQSELKVNSLGGFVDYIKACNEIKAFIHVNYNRVCLLSDPHLQTKKRTTFCVAENPMKPFSFGNDYNVEEFIIALHGFFVSNTERDQLLKCVANIRDSKSKELNDDGVTQKVTVNQGVTMVGVSEIKNPVRLRPYRTFIEVDQPEGRFVFRVNKDRHDSVNCRLIDADGGRWKLDAIANIKEYLEKAELGLPIIA